MRVQEVEKLSLEPIRAFWDASVEMRFEGQNRSAIYAWVNTTLRPHDYERLGRSAKGLLRRFGRKMTGDSRAQLTRLIHAIPERQRSATKALPAAALSDAFHASRYRVTGRSGGSA